MSNIESAGLVLDRVGVFRDLDGQALREVAAVIEPMKLSGGAILFDEGDSGDTLYIVAHGRLRVSVRTTPGRRRTVAELGRGESVGEMALITGERRSARVEAIRDSVLLALSRAAFEHVIERYPRVMTQLARQLVERLKRSLNGAPARSALTTICVLPAAREGDTRMFCERLAGALCEFGPTLHLTREVARSALASDLRLSDGAEAQDARLIAWLNEQEERFDYVVYDTNSNEKAWLGLCERQADRILLVAGTQDQPADNAPTSTEGASGTARRELVLLNTGSVARGRTADWLRRLQDVQSWHHVTEGNPHDFVRLARMIAGRGIGLLLGGGGARSFAHIGVYRAMSEAGIEIDSFGGVSGGAIAGAQFAAGGSAAEVRERMRAEFISRGSLLDFTVPIVSLIRGERFLGLLTRVFGADAIEDLPKRFFCTSANLSQATMRVHDRGPLWWSVGASISIPGIGPPVCERGDLLIDGSVLTNLPVETMRELCQGRVVAIDVSAERDLSVDPDWATFPAPARLVLARPWRRRGLRIPTILEILFRAAMLNSIASERDVRARVDFYLRPPLRGIGLMDFKVLDRVERAAYEYSVKALEQWHAAMATERVV